MTLHHLVYAIHPLIQSIFHPSSTETHHTCIIHSPPLKLSTITILSVYYPQLNPFHASDSPYAFIPGTDNVTASPSLTLSHFIKSLLEPLPCQSMCSQQHSSPTNSNLWARRCHQNSHNTVLL